MHFTQVYAQNWMILPRDLRRHLALVFKIVPTGITEVKDNVVISDGFTNDNLKLIDAVKMAEYLKVPLDMYDFAKLWELTLGHANHELHPVVVNMEGITIMPQEVSALSQSPVEELDKKVEATITTATSVELPEIPKLKRKYAKKTK